jgi:hypothetical protein
VDGGGPGYKEKLPSDFRLGRAFRILSTAFSITFTGTPQPAHVIVMFMYSIAEKEFFTRGASSMSVFSRNGRGKQLTLCDRAGPQQVPLEESLHSVVQDRRG